MLNSTSTIPDWRKNALPGRSLSEIQKSDTAETPTGEVYDIPIRRRARMSGFSEPQNLSTSLDADRIQAALRAAERGQTWQLFTIYRDMVLGYSHLQSEWMKRKTSVVGQPHSLIPKRKANKDDEIAAEVIQQMIDGCENWTDGLIHCLDATLYPVSVLEKIFEPVEMSESQNYEHQIRYKLKSLDPVSYTLLCFQIPYTPSFGVGNSNPALKYDVDSWEPDLRIYKTQPNGAIDWSLADVYAPTPERNVVHRGDFLSRAIRDNFGGQMRAILFWWLLATKDRDWFGLYMQKYGSPFPVGKVDAQNKELVEMMQNAFALSTQIGGMVIDKKAQVDLIQAAAQDGSNAHKTLITLCNDEVSKIIVGQVLSSSAKNTGLGSGVADLHGEVMAGICLFDKKRLNETLKNQVFTPYLRINGYKGNAPDILWGGEKEADALSLAGSLQQFYVSGLEPTDDAIDVLGRRVGYSLQRREMPDENPTAAPTKKPKPKKDK